MSLWEADWDGKGPRPTSAGAAIVAEAYETHACWACRIGRRSFVGGSRRLSS